MDELSVMFQNMSKNMNQLEKILKKNNISHYELDPQSTLNKTLVILIKNSYYKSVYVNILCSEYHYLIKCHQYDGTIHDIWCNIDSVIDELLNLSQQNGINIKKCK